MPESWARLLQSANISKMEQKQNAHGDDRRNELTTMVLLVKLILMMVVITW